jgi:hypothetical protein
MWGPETALLACSQMTSGPLFASMHCAKKRMAERQGSHPEDVLKASHMGMTRQRMTHQGCSPKLSMYCTLVQSMVVQSEATRPSMSAAAIRTAFSGSSTRVCVCPSNVQHTRNRRTDRVCWCLETTGYRHGFLRSVHTPSNPFRILRNQVRRLSHA